MALVPGITGSPIVFENGFAVDFATPVPESFSEAIRKRQLSKGDVFYSVREAYSNRDWNDVLGKLSYVIQIRESLTGGRIVFFELFRVRNAARLTSAGKFKLDWDKFLERLQKGDFSMTEDEAVKE